MKNFRQLTLEGISWNIKNQLVSQTINLIVGISLVRMLTPEDFGIVAMVLVISGFAIVFRNIGLSQAVIQAKEIDNNIVSTAFWIQVLIGIIISILFFSSASLIVLFYNESLLKPIVWLFALDYLFGTLGLIPFALLQKKIDFKRICYINICATIVSGLLAVAMAYFGFKYWSLVAKSLAFTIISTGLVLIISDWKPTLTLNRKSAKKLFSYGLPLFGNQLFNYGVRNIDDILIGKILGQYSLGLYSRAYSLMLMPLTNISRVIANVLFPSFSRIQDDPDRLRQIYLKVISVVALITFPLMIGLFVLADPFVNIVFGHQWIEIIPVVKILSILGLAQSIGMFNGVVFLSLGKTKKLFNIEIFSKSFMIGMIVWGVLYTKSITGVALFYAISSCIIIFPVWYYMGRLIGTTIKEILKTLLSVSLVAILMGSLVYLINRCFFIDYNNIFVLLFQILLGVIFYLFLIAIFRIKPYEVLKKELMNRNLK